ncbi:HAD-IA family hydrolase [Marisediminicola sp. LYQ134]|uniref:HAD-IA family hydrolase n=1 Tax=Marisediminicola sp. LYQ134 TaxID=3391061 RepID=UPI00398396E9
MLLFIFDMDEVLYRYDWRTRMAALSREVGLSVDELKARWWHDTGERAAEAGAWTTSSDYLAAFEAAIGRQVDEQAWVAARASAMEPIPASLDAVRLAARLGRVTLLTNNGALTAHHLPTIAPHLVELFGDHLHTTSDYRARKPDPVVFERVLEAYGVDATDAFFADDLVENVAAAESVGITGHVFTTGEEMSTAITEFARARPGDERA